MDEHETPEEWEAMRVGSPVRSDDITSNVYTTEIHGDGQYPAAQAKARAPMVRGRTMQPAPESRPQNTFPALPGMPAQNNRFSQMLASGGGKPVAPSLGGLVGDAASSFANWDGPGPFAATTPEWRAGNRGKVANAIKAMFGGGPQSATAAGAPPVLPQGQYQGMDADALLRFSQE